MDVNEVRKKRIKNKNLGHNFVFIKTVVYGTYY